LLELLATTCEIHGGDITFEQPFRNIGCWHGEHDHVVWTVRVEKAGDYDIYLDYACDDRAAGNRFVLQGNRDSERGTVAGTGGWDKYRRAKHGNITLAAGLQRLVLRPAGQVNGALLDLRGVLLVPGGVTPPAPGQSAVEIAAILLDDKRPRAEREALIKDHPELAAELIAAMTADLTADAKEEYRRIPWIWRVAIAAGRRNDAGQLKQILDVALPWGNQPLRHWQAVVLGGGIINGISLTGAWPGERIDVVLKDDLALQARRNRTLELAPAMADNENVPTGTRYDALRLLGVDTWERRGAQLVKYLAKGVDEELQMGAISAVGDMPRPAPGIAQALLKGLGHYSKRNLELALDALVRDNLRAGALLDAVAAGRVSADELGEKRTGQLKNAKDDRLRERARQLLGK
jgi:hypothetical protein